MDKFTRDIPAEKSSKTGKNGRKRKKQIPFRVTESEYEMVVSKAQKIGLSIQGYLIRAMKESVITSDETNAILTDMAAQIKDADRQLKGIAVNINQMAHSVNAGLQRVDIERLKDMVCEVDANRKEQDKRWQFLRSLIEARVVPQEHPLE